MRRVVLVVFLFVFVPLLQAAPPGYVLKTTPAKVVEAVFTFSVQAPRLTASEWILVAARLPELPSQSRVKSTLEPAGKNADDQSDLHRPLLLARVPGKGKETAVTVTVRYAATLHARTLVPVQPGTKLPEVPPLQDAARTQALRTSATVDHQSAGFQKWLDKEGLRKRNTEGDLDFARRVFLHITRSLTYEYKAVMKREASALCQMKATDCGGMAVLFVATLRANKVPTRLLVGRWAESAKRGEKVGDVPYFQWHVKAEFFADGIGWVPVDLSSGVLHDRTPARLQYFGHDRGDFLVQHVDPDLLVDSVHFGKHTVTWLQGLSFWATGSGSFDGLTTSEDWQVTAR